MINILTDVFILSAAFSEVYTPFKDSISEVYRDDILTKYKIKYEQLQWNMDRLRTQPERLDSIYIQVHHRLDQLENDIDSDIQKGPNRSQPEE